MPTVYSGHARQFGVDASNAFSSPNSFYNSDSVNRKYRGGLNQTRDPFVVLNHSFQDDNSKYVMRNGNVSGVFGYEKMGFGTDAHIIIAVGDSILAGRVFTGAVRFRTLYKGIDPKWEHSFFAQSQNILVWQNGKDLPLWWDGSDSEMTTISGTSGVSNPMPIGNIMTTANGRILVATESNLVFASNYVYSKGVGTTIGVLDFTESTYPNSGDGFGAYSEIGPITGMHTLPARGSRNGDGETIVFGPKGAWSIQTEKSRDEWTASDIQRQEMVGRGTVSPYSITPVNNDLWYRSSDLSIASLRRQLTDSDSKWADSSLSREVQKYLDYDDSINLRFSSGMSFGNRLFMSCCIKKQKSFEFGIHRFGLGLSVLDFDRGSSTTKQDEGYSWDGLYTGPRVTGMAKISPDLQERGLFVSFDSDGVNRVYEIRRSESEDIVGDNRTEKKIVSCYVTSELFRIDDTSFKPSSNRIKISQVEFSGSKSSTIEQSYRGGECSETLMEPQSVNCHKCEETECSSLSNVIPPRISGKMVSKSVKKSEKSSSRSFWVKTRITGRSNIRSMSVSAERSEESQTITNEIDCPDACCDSQFLFEYSF